MHGFVLLFLLKLVLIQNSLFPDFMFLQGRFRFLAGGIAIDG